MNPEVKTQWLEALRSGEFQQGTGALCEGGKYCCLGVLSELAVRAGVVRGYDGGTQDGAPRRAYGLDEDGADLDYPSWEVVRWAGLASRTPKVEAAWDENDWDPEIDDLRVLSIGLDELNDDRLWSFGEIADVIEDQL